MHLHRLAPRPDRRCTVSKKIAETSDWTAFFFKNDSSCEQWTSKRGAIARFGDVSDKKITVLKHMIPWTGSQCHDNGWLKPVWNDLKLSSKCGDHVLEVPWVSHVQVGLMFLLVFPHVCRYVSLTVSVQHYIENICKCRINMWKQKRALFHRMRPWQHVIAIPFKNRHPHGQQPSTNPKI